MTVMKFQLKMKLKDIKMLEFRACGIPPTEDQNDDKECDDVEIVIRRKRKEIHKVFKPVADFVPSKTAMEL